MLNLRIVQGPLLTNENEAILSQYNKLSLSQIPLDEFLHWVQKGPAGPAWHAILESETKEIVGHTCLIPFLVNFEGKQLLPAKSEYTFIREDAGGRQIRGVEKVSRPRNLILIDRLFRHCASQGWGPFLISTFSSLHRLGPSVRCYPADFPLRECLLILRPWKAAKKTPNLSEGQRTVFFMTGLFQAAFWRIILLFTPRFGVASSSVTGESLPGTESTLSFFADEDSMRWRYPEDQYVRLSPESNGQKAAYIIAKKGSSDRYLRICQWQLSSCQPTFPLIRKLIQVAKSEGALGVRWAVYGSEEESTRLASRMRRFGFLSATRVRTLLLFSEQQELLSADKWKLTDAMFSFDP